MLRVDYVIGKLPDGFDELRGEAYAEGYRFVERLATDWAAGTTRFDRHGEALLAAYMDGVLAGIGGRTLDPVVPDALRVRRFYVRAACRNQGTGRRLVEALLEFPRRAGTVVLVNAAQGSAAFWEALGFVPERRDGHSHVFDPGIGVSKATG